MEERASADPRQDYRGRQAKRPRAAGPDHELLAKSFHWSASVGRCRRFRFLRQFARHDGTSGTRVSWECWASQSDCGVLPKRGNSHAAKSPRIGQLSASRLALHRSGWLIGDRPQFAIYCKQLPVRVVARNSSLDCFRVALGTRSASVNLAQGFLTCPPDGGGFELIRKQMMSYQIHEDSPLRVRHFLNLERSPAGGRTAVGRRLYQG